MNSIQCESCKRFKQIQGTPVSGGLNKVRLVSFAREEFDEAVVFIKNNCYIKRTPGDDQPLMFTCGVGASQFGTKIEKELRIK